MLNNTEEQKTKSEDNLNPLSFMAVLLYYPALGFAIRLGFSMYGYFFDNLKGVEMIFGIIVTLIITLIFAIVALSIISLLLSIGDKTWTYISKKEKTV